MPKHLTTSTKEKPKRLTPKSDVVRRLYLLSGNECAEPSCKNVLIDSNQTMTGDIAHIESAMPDGKRFNKSMTNEQRRSFDNLLLLCAVHHRAVDGKNAPHDVPQLKKWKADHERRFAAAEQTLLKRFRTNYPDASSDLSPTLPVEFVSFRSVMGSDILADGEIAPTAKAIADYVDSLENAPPDHRDLMLSILKGAIKRNSFQWDRPTLLCDELTSSFGVSAYKLKRMVPTLEKYGLAWFSEDMSDNATLELANPCDEISWAVIADFGQAVGTDLERFVISLQFGDLD